MLKQVGSFFVGVAAEAGFVFETSQPFPGRGFMGIVAGGALHNAFLESVPFVQLELRGDVFMAHRAAFGFVQLEHAFLCGVSVLGMAGRAVQGGLAVRAGQVA